MRTLIGIVIIAALSVSFVAARKHHLQLTNDIRKYFKVSTFGYLTAGELTIDVPEFSFQPFNPKAKYGITLARTMSDSLNPYLEGQEDHCLLLDDVSSIVDSIALVSMTFDFQKNFPQLTKLRIGEPSDKNRRKREDHQVSALNQTLKGSPTNNTVKTKTNISNLPSPISGNSSLPESKPNVVAEKSKPSVYSPPIEDKKVIDGEANTNSKNGIANPLNPIHSKVTPEKTLNIDRKPLPPNDENLDVSDNEDDEDQPENGEPANPSVGDQGLKSEPIINESDDNTKGSCELARSIPLKALPNNVYSFKFKMIVVDPSHEGLYSVFWHSCPNYGIEYSGLTRLNLSMFITEKNLDNYLSAGEAPLPELYFALSILFFMLGIVWVHIVKSKREESFKIHYLMGALVFVKAFALLFHGIDFHYIATRGSESETWAVLYYVLHLLKGALLFITIVLIGTGWTFVKHILSDKDKKIFMIVIPLQVLANIAEIITDESEEGDMKHTMWKQVFILVDLLCCGAILFPVVWSIRHLQEASHIDGKAAINLKKLKIFRRFYIMIVCYIYFTRIIVYLLKITVPFQYEWLDVFSQHAAILVFFVMTGYHFQPAMQNPYFQLSQDDDLEMEEVLFEITPNTYTENLKKKSKSVKIEVEADGDTQRLITKRESSHDFD